LAIERHLFDEAVELALAHPDLRSRLPALTALERERLGPALYDAADEVERMVAGELGVYRLAAERLRAAEAEPVGAAAAEHLRPVMTQYRAEIERLQALQDEGVRIHRERAAAIEGRRAELELRRGRLQATGEDLGRVRRRFVPPRLRLRGRPELVALEQDFEALRLELERLQHEKRELADVVVAKKRAQLQLLRLQERVGPEAPTPPTLDLDAARVHMQAVRARTIRALAERGVLPIARRWLNDRLDQRHETRFRIDLGAAAARGLAELSSLERRVDTAASARLARLIEQLPGGSIGICGARGAGKTTLIRSVCEATEYRRALAVMIAAPVRFQPLEFVLHLFDRACRAVLVDDDEIEPLQRAGRESDGMVDRFERARRAARACGVVLAAVGVAAIVAGVAGHDPTPLQARLLLAAALAGSGLVVLLAGSTRTRDVAVLLGFMCGGAYAAACVLVTAVSGTWPIWAWCALTAAAALGAAEGVVLRWVAAVAVPRLAVGAGAVLLLGGAALAAVGSSLHAVSTSFAVGVALLQLVVLGIPLVALAARRRLTAAARPTKGRRDAYLVALDMLRFDLAGMTALLVAFALAALGAGLVVLGWLQLTPAPAVVAGVALAALGANVAVGAFNFGRLGRLIALQPNAVGDAPPEQDAAADRAFERLQVLARDHLRHIKFQLGYTAERSVKLTAALKLLGAEASHTGSRSSTEHPPTLPEVIDRLREFLADAAEIAGGFVIGIDELDKIGSPEEAEAFLNEIKAIFGIPGCHFLISVSEDAVASFERRGMPFRDVFDSTFDEVIRVGSFRLVETEALLRERTVEMPLPFVALCHVLAGGLPRDVIRMARRLFDLRDQTGEPSLGPLTRALVGAELTARRNGTVTAIVRRTRGEADGGLLEWLGSKPTAPRLIAGPHSGPTADGEAGRLAAELGAYAYFATTLVEFFRDERDPREIEQAETSTADDSLELLAYACRDFAIHPALAWEHVSSFRRAWKLPELAPPVPAERLQA
jgi:hypothetical protein